MMGGGMLLWILVLAGIVWVLVTAGQRAGGRTTSARAILDERFARGELSAEEYRKLRSELER